MNYQDEFGKLLNQASEEASKGEHEKAILTLTQALRIKYDPRALLFRGESRLQSGKVYGAQSDLEEVAKLAGGKPLSPFLQPLFDSLLEKIQLKRKEIDSERATNGSTQASPTSSYNHMDWQNKTLDSRATQQSINPDVRSSELLEEAKKMYKAKDRKGAVTYLTLSIGAVPTIAAYSLLAQIHFEDKDLDAAKKASDNSLKLAKECKSAEEVQKVQLINQQISDAWNAREAEKQSIIESRDLMGMLKVCNLNGKKKKILNSCLDSIRVRSTSQEHIAAGASRIAGNPDLPNELAWPTSNDDEPLHFLCQINFADLSNLATASLLPRSGMLSFFCERYLDVTSSEDKWKCLHFTETAVLSSRRPPESLITDTFGSRKLDFEEEKSFPDGLIDEDEYPEFLETWYRSLPIHRILGHPQLVQGELEEELPSIRRQKWLLLFQLDSEDELQWSDAGRLYFCIPDAALQAADFSKVKLVIQSY